MNNIIRTPLTKDSLKGFDALRAKGNQLILAKTARCTSARELAEETIRNRLLFAAHHAGITLYKVYALQYKPKESIQTLEQFGIISKDTLEYDPYVVLSLLPLYLASSFTDKDYPHEHMALFKDTCTQLDQKGDLGEFWPQGWRFENVIQALVYDMVNTSHINMTQNDYLPFLSKERLNNVLINLKYIDPMLKPLVDEDIDGAMEALPLEKTLVNLHEVVFSEVNNNKEG